MLAREVAPAARASLGPGSSRGCILLLLQPCSAQQRIVQARYLGTLEEQVLDEGLEQSAALARRRSDGQRDGQARVLH